MKTQRSALDNLIYNLFVVPHIHKNKKSLPTGQPIKPEIDLRPQQPAILPPYPDVRKKDVRIEDVTRIVLFELLEKNLHHFAIHERMGRVVLASYQPHNQYDPVLPVPLIRLSPEFKTAYRNLASVLSSWVDAMFSLYYQCEEFNAYTGYLHRMPSKPGAVITENYTQKIRHWGYQAIYRAAETDQWTELEWEYFHFQMLLSMSRPDRFTDYDNEATKTIWQKAVAYNITLSNT